MCSSQRANQIQWESECVQGWRLQMACHAGTRTEYRAADRAARQTIAMELAYSTHRAPLYRAVRFVERAADGQCGRTAQIKARSALLVAKR